jgi:hypothetical protein
LLGKRNAPGENKNSDAPTATASPACKVGAQSLATVAAPLNASRSTPLQCLKIKLGREASLLQYIPINDLKLVPTDRFLSFVPYRILVGHGDLDKWSCKIWAFLSETVQEDGCCEVKLYREDFTGRFHEYSVEEMECHGRWLDMFDVGGKVEATVFIKVRE